MFDLELTASDGSFAVTDAFTLTLQAVNDAPVVVAALPDVSANEGEAFAFTINPAAFADADGDTLSLSAGLVGGAALPSWLAFDGTTLTGRSPANFSGTVNVEIRCARPDRGLRTGSRRQQRHHRMMARNASRWNCPASPRTTSTLASMMVW